MTVGRIRNFLNGWKGQPANRVPFGCHAVKYLMAIIDGEINPHDEPKDAPWVLHPRKPGPHIDHEYINRAEAIANARGVAVDRTEYIHEADPIMETVEQNVGQFRNPGHHEAMADPMNPAMIMAEAVKEAVAPAPEPAPEEEPLW